MNFNLKNIIAVGAVFAVGLPLAYGFLPQFRSVVPDVGPFLLFPLLLLCPLLMMFMMKGMHSDKARPALSDERLKYPQSRHETSSER